MIAFLGMVGPAAGQSRALPSRLDAPAGQSGVSRTDGGGALAASLPDPRVVSMIDREAAAMPAAPPLAARVGVVGPQQSTPSRSWIRRHPVLFGALLGGAAGAVSSAGRWTELYCASGGDEDCLFHGGSGVLFGAGVGAGVGALVGALVGR